MSAKVSIWAWQQASTIPDSTTLLVFLGLADIVYDHGRYYGAQKTLAEKVRLGERTVRRAISALEELGLISITPRAGRTDVIQLCLSAVTIFADGPDGPEDVETPATAATTPAGTARAPATAADDPGNLPKSSNPKTPAGAGNLFGEEDSPPPAQAKDPPPGAFELFWREYPRKTAVGAARAAFTKAWPKIPDPKVDPRSPVQPAPGFEKCLTLMRAIDAQKPGWTDPKFIPHASTWLNQERWADEATVAPTDVKRRFGSADWN